MEPNHWLYMDEELNVLLANFDRGSQLRDAAESVELSETTRQEIKAKYKEHAVELAKFAIQVLEVGVLDRPGTIDVTDDDYRMQDLAHYMLLSMAKSDKWTE